VIVCMKCGEHNPDDGQWCIRCKAFLEWDGEKVATAVAPEVVPEAPADERQSRKGLIQRIKGAVGMDGPKKGPTGSA
jgi:hypothetical protein